LGFSGFDLPLCCYPPQEWNFLAFDASNGNVLLKEDFGDPIGGGVVPYMLDGVQYIAVAGGMTNPPMQMESGPAWVAIFSLPDRSNR
jgi:hypothetical protein